MLNDHHFAVTFYHVLGRKAWAFDRKPMHRYAPGMPGHGRWSRSCVFLYDCVLERESLE